jgi:hypothetical protein
MSASISVPRQVFVCLAATPISGHLLADGYMVDEERLATPGVDGARWRTGSLQYPPAVYRTVSESSSFQLACIMAKDMRLAKGQLATVTIVADGFSHVFKDVHISDVEPLPFKGTPVGAGASASSTAHVVCLWTFEQTEFGASASA